MTPDKPSASEARELLPCPFCGITPEENAFGYYHNGTESREIGCKNINCRIKPIIIRDQDEEYDFDLAETWNTRASPAPQGGERDTKSAPAVIGSLPSGESGPSVTSGLAGADTLSRALETIALDFENSVHHVWDNQEVADRIREIASRLPSPAGSVEQVRRALLLFRMFTLRNATQWQMGTNHHHPIWQLVAEALGPMNESEPRSGEDWLLIQPLTDKRPPMQEDGK